MTASGRTLAQLFSNKRIVICLGPGGVGKTTSAAAIAYAEASLSKRACVVTIDPARRLASALGLADLGNQATLVTKVGKGELWATMLDAHATFDDMVRKYATSTEQVDRILGNRLYQNLTTSLSGTQEYMAMERLYELYEDDRFDIIVVDTPPSISALDFLDAPKRLGSFLDNRIFKLLIKPPPTYLKPLSVATRALLKTISKVVGAEVVDDAIQFFESFAGIEDGFRERANEVERLLGSEETGIVVITSPRPQPMSEASGLASRLRTANRQVNAIVVNRITPDFGVPPAQTDSDVDPVIKNWLALAAQRVADLKISSDLVTDGQPILFIDEILGEVSDMGGIEAIAKVVATVEMDLAGA